MKQFSSIAAIIFALVSGHAAYAQTAQGAIIEQVKPGSMIVHKADAEPATLAAPATPATQAAPVKKLRAKNMSELQEIIRLQTAGQTLPDGETGASTPLSGLSSDPSTLQKEKALQQAK